MRIIKFVMLSLVAAASLFTTGCASTYVVSSHNRNTQLQQENRALQIAATPNGELRAGFNVLASKGYWQAWKSEPAAMTGATLLDLITGTAAVWGISEVRDANDDDDDKADVPVIQNMAGGTVIVNTGAGSASYSYQESN